MPRHDLKDEAVYEREKAEQHLWEAARTARISRRRFLQFIGAGFVVSTLPGGLLTACANDKATKEEVATEEKVIKPTSSDYFYVHNGNREMRWEAMADQGYYTPNWLFFVRNHTSTPRDIDLSSWRVGIEGSGVENPTEFTYDDLLGMEEVSVTTAIECAGNGRSFFDLFQGRKVEGTQWKLGAIGIAEWTGVRLRELLERAKVKPTAVDVMPSGLDSEVEDKGHVRRPMPIEKAMDDETLLIYGMNGEDLPQDHGYPARVLVPGWAGIANIKWVGNIEVSESPLYSDWNTNNYVMIGDAYPNHPVLTTQNLKSAFELPWDGQIEAGRRQLTGRSWSGDAEIEQVEVSMDGGSTWQDAELANPNISKAWAQWSIDWDVQPGRYGLQARATDRDGNTQPSSVPFNEKGYLYNAVVEHPITVA
ncbi:MAG: hypothetical protein QOI57_2928 [Rubrobacteraceae bacterium]|jgi:DMSO/TMAO reductase YedYZ molybdopterin-dependent catalytic subunit|nr:hypothetical protein [Rubrobacteraceae bacterium]